MPLGALTRPWTEAAREIDGRFHDTPSRDDRAIDVSDPLDPCTDQRRAEKVREIARDEIDAVSTGLDVEVPSIRLRIYDDPAPNVPGSGEAMHSAVGEYTATVVDGYDLLQPKFVEHDGSYIALAASVIDTHGEHGVRAITRHELAHAVDTNRHGFSIESHENFQSTLDELYAPARVKELHDHGIPTTIDEIVE